MARTVYVLGAGFSRLAGGPLLREMLDTDREENAKAVGHLWARHEFHALREVLGTLPAAERNIEGLFNVVRSGELYRDTFGRYRPAHMMEFLIEYVATLVRKRIGNFSEEPVYQKFRDIFLSNNDIAIVTFNYDLVADNLLMEVHDGLDYAFPAATKYRYFRLRNARGGPPLLKLHGSLSWVICGSCHTLWMHDRYADHKAGSTCLKNDCLGRLRTLIVPPMWNKETAAKQIALVWEAAREELMEAERIVVIGFSFPALDRASIDLMRAVLRFNHRTYVDVYNGPSYDYASLTTTLGRELRRTGGRFEDFVTEA